MMKLEEWLTEREKRERAYDKLCSEGWKAGFHYQRTGEGLSSLFAIIRRIDAAYLRWCETDGWEVKYD